MKKEKVKISRVNKILLTMHKLSKGQKRNIRFEDLVVVLFQDYPDQFHLKGYPKFPDSEAVNNALYHNLKRKGLITYGNKVFTLTERGLIVAEKLRELVDGKDIIQTVRLPKFEEKEIQRIKSLEGFQLFLKRDKSHIIDTDFYSYLGVSVRTERGEFLGRLASVEEVIKMIEKLNKKERKNPIYKKIVEYHKFITKKFEDIIKYYRQTN